MVDKTATQYLIRPIETWKDIIMESNCSKNGATITAFVCFCDVLSRLDCFKWPNTQKFMKIMKWQFAILFDNDIALYI